jgi:glycosyltransferase involved in cell wall biosynthesis
MFHYGNRNVSDLIYAWNHICYDKSPWVLDLEHIFAPFGYNIRQFYKNKTKFQRSLVKDNCKRIICPTKLACDEFNWTIPNGGLESKLVMVHRAVSPKPLQRRSAERVTTLLFVGSANEPGAFEHKGGKEALEAYKILKKTYPNLNLIIRSDVPDKIKLQYAKMHGLKFYEGILSQINVDKLFSQADLFIMPTRATPAVVFLDAMSFGLPIIATDVAANSEFVQDGKNGVLLPKPASLPDIRELLLGSRLQEEWFETASQIEVELVESLVKAVSKIIDDPNLWRRMREASRQQVEIGEFSIRNRNKKLKQIFDEATS